LRSAICCQFEKFGKPIYASAEWSEYLPDWHPWENYRDSYAARGELGGGVYLTQVHPINYLEYIFGPIKEITSRKYNSGTLGIEVDDSADSLVTFKNGMIGHVHVDYIQRPRVHRMKIATDRGRFEWDCHQNTLTFTDESGIQEAYVTERFERNDMFLEMVSSFLNDVEARRQTRFSLDDAALEISHILS
jgi:predicted dehydrogenase